MSDDLEICGIACVFLEFLQRFDRHIFHLTAGYATDMIMVVGRPIESFPGTGQVQLLGHAPLGEDLQITIYRAEADPRHPFPNRVIDLVGSGMGMQILEFFENDPPLSGHPEGFLEWHESVPARS
jgi:hypothetical protein